MGVQLSVVVGLGLVFEAQEVKGFSWPEYILKGGVVEEAVEFEFDVMG